jgi:hypothetical protein
MEQQKTAQQQDELEEMQHGPVPVEQLQVTHSELQSISNSQGIIHLGSCSIWL